MTKTELIDEGWIPDQSEYLCNKVFSKGRFQLSILKKYKEVWISKWVNHGKFQAPERVYAGICDDIQTLRYLSKLLKIS